VITVVCALIPCSANGQEKSLSQYLREEWGSEKGFPGGAINAIAQTPDGYLWIGTQRGLVRFDGRSFRLIQETNTNGNPIGPVLGLLADEEGNLWVRLGGAGLLRYRDGKFEDLTNRFDVPEDAVTQMCRAADGHAMFVTIQNGTVIYDRGKFLRIAGPPDLSNFLVTSIAPGFEGEYWLGTRDLGLFDIRGGRISPRRDILTERQITVLLSAGTNQLWIGTDRGLLLWDGHEIKQIGLGSPFRERQIISVAKDANGSVWVGTDHGLYRLDPELNFAPKSENTTGDLAVTAIFRDREGNVWTGTLRGLQRIRNPIFTSYGALQGIPGEGNGSVHPDPEGHIWFAPIHGGLYWLKGETVGLISEAGLSKDVVYSIAGGNGDLWIARQSGGLTHLQNVAGKWHGVTYTNKDGLAQNSVYTVRVGRDGTVWAGTLSAGLTRIKNGRFETFTMNKGLISNTIASILEGRDGTMWFATPRGLNSFYKNHWISFSSNNGLPSNDVDCLFEDSDGTLWIGTAQGLAALRSGKIFVPAYGHGTLSEPVYGIQADASGFLWISTSNHVVMISKERLLQPDFNSADIREFGIADGLRGTDGVKRDEAVASDNEGNIWFSSNRGLSVVDVQKVRSGSPPSILHFEGLSVDGNPLSVQDPARLPANPQRVTINFTGVSLSAPERVQFKYKLDSFDTTWSNPVTTREATYTNLNPGSYVFRIIASNSDGLWNSAELTLPFTIEPVFWRTWWFSLAALFFLGLAVLALIRLRVHALTHQLNVRFEERLAERTRIAQELHDTLLQGLLSASMQLSVANDQLDSASPAKPLVNRVLQLMTRVVDEGRNAVRGLRSSSRAFENLEQAFSTIPQELGMEEQVSLRVILEGTQRCLRPSIRDEIYLVGREAIVNALRHSGAKEIEIRIEYAPNRLRLSFSDNGSGINPQILKEGREGHWGLSGMRERAERIGAKLRLLSRISSGTEVELLVPATIVYEPDSSMRGSKLVDIFRFRFPWANKSEKVHSQEQQ